MLRTLSSAMVAVLLAACATPNQRDTYDAITAELERAAQANVQPAAPAEVAAALLPPLQIEMPRPAEPLEERFNVTFNNVPAPQFFMAIVSGTRYNMLVHPEVRGTISANLKDVTVPEALDAIRELYGYDYRIEGNRITVRPAGMQTQVFQVNYLTGSRRGASELRVTSTTVADVGPTGSNTQTLNAAGQPVAGTNQTARAARESSMVATELDTDFWGELRQALDLLIGGARDGRSVVVSPQSGVVVVRAMPEELRSVSSYLRAMQLSVARQVILEAKIIEVELSAQHQTGINWAAFRRSSGSPASIGMVQPGSSVSPLGAGNAAGQLAGSGMRSTPGSALSAIDSAAGALFGLAFQTNNFGALISFLESQGNVHVLSSPRIATLNNQKAVLKIGDDEFFVTNVSTTTVTGTATATTPSVTLQPFFSGVVLDVTPQIDEQGYVILHVRPSVTQVEPVDRNINLGAGNQLTLPLARSRTSETDSIVRGRDGQIVAIGGLMRQASQAARSQVPGAGDVPGIGGLFRNTNQATQKRELVILLKPTIVQDDSTWAQDILDSQERIRRLAPREEQPLRW